MVLAVKAYLRKLIQSEKEIKELYDYIKGKKVIIEEVISQCKELKDLNPSSVNTIRVYSVEKRKSNIYHGSTTPYRKW